MRRLVFFAALFAACALCSGAATALDLNDVKNLVRNNVDEAVVIGMVQQGGSFSVSTDDLAELRGMGASETLISSLLTAPSTTGEYILQDGTTVAVPQTTPPPTVYYEAPPGVVTQPPTIVYQTPTYVYPYAPYPRPHYFRSRPGISFSFGFGGGGYRHRRPYRRWR